MRAYSESRRAIVGAMVGLLYGSILAFLSFLANFAGHGTDIPLLLSSTPLGVFGFVAKLVGAPHVDVVARLFGTPLVWAALGSLVALSGRGKRLRLTQALVLLCYGSGLALVATRGEGPAYLERLLRAAPEFIVAWATVYLVGQVALWRQIGRRLH